MNSSVYKTGSIKDVYKFEEFIGEGSFAVVRKIIRKSTNEPYAVKIIDKRNLEHDDHLSLQIEVDIMSRVDHPNITKLFEVYEDKSYIYCVMEYMAGGELFDRIVMKESYSEKEASDAIKPVVDAIRYCHSLGIVHRDLKPENLLYESSDPRAILKVADFGLAKVISNEMMMTACGTPGYVAPEVLEGKGYDLAVDYWSLGVIIYVMLCGFPPFAEDSNEKLFRKIKQGEYEFPSPHWDNISSLAKDLISKLLVVDPKKRLTIDEIRDHPWVVGNLTPRTKISNPFDFVKRSGEKKSNKSKARSAIIKSVLAEIDQNLTAL